MYLSRIKYLFTILVLAFSSCKKLVPEAAIPAYLQIDSFAYDTNSLVDASLSKTHRIENVWVYADNVFLGVYALPAKIPVLKTGNVKFDLRPGIKQNGISSTRIDYPFYTVYSPEYNLVAGKTIVVPARTSYFNFVQIPFSEAFERNDLFLEKLTTSYGVNINRKSGIFEGNFGGEINLSANDTVCFIVSKYAFSLPIGGRNVYLELDYKTNAEFIFGIIANTAAKQQQQQIFTFNPSLDDAGTIIWKKIYIDMSPEVSNNSGALDYKIYFYAHRGLSDADINISLDNIKVVKGSS